MPIPKSILVTESKDVLVMKYGENQQHQLGNQNPSASPPEKGERVSVHQGSPEKLHRIGKTHQGKNSDGSQIHPLDRHPRLEGSPCQRQWKPRSKSQNSNYSDSSVSQRVQGLENFFDRSQVI